MSVSIAAFNRARTNTEDALATIRDAAIDWLTEEIVRQTEVKLSLGDATSGNDKITVKLDIPCNYVSPTNMSPAILLSEDHLNIAMGRASFRLANNSIIGHTGVKVSRIQPGLGGRINGIGFTIVINTDPY